MVMNNQPLFRAWGWVGIIEGGFGRGSIQGKNRLHRLLKFLIGQIS